MKKILLFLLLIAVIVIFYKCDDPGVEYKDDRYEISGTITNWNLGTKILKAFVYDSMWVNDFIADSTLINTNGSFTIKLKEPPENFKYIYSVNSDSFCTNNVQIQPAGTKTTYVFFNVFNDSNHSIGGIIWKNYDSVITTGSFWADFIYLSNNVSITGTQTCVYGSETYITNFLLSGLKKGWNKTYYRTLSSFEHEITLIEPSGGRWDFHPTSVLQKNEY